MLSAFLHPSSDEIEAAIEGMTEAEADAPDEDMRAPEPRPPAEED